MFSLLKFEAYFTNYSTNTRHVYTYFNAFSMLIPNTVTKFKNGDILLTTLLKVNLLSAHHDYRMMRVFLCGGYNIVKVSFYNVMMNKGHWRRTKPNNSDFLGIHNDIPLVFLWAVTWIEGCSNKHDASRLLEIIVTRSRLVGKCQMSLDLDYYLK